MGKDRKIVSKIGLRVLLFWSFLFNLSSLYAINVDSLKKQWHNSKLTFDNRAKSLDLIIYHFESNNLDSALYYTNKLIDFAKHHKSKHWILQGLSTKGNQFYSMDNPDSAMFYFERSLKMAVAQSSYKDIIRIRNNMGNIYADRGQNKIAIQCYQQNIKDSYKYQYFYVLAESYNNMGLIYQSLNQYEESIFNFKEGLKLYTKDRNYEGQVDGLISCAASYSSLKQFDSSRVLLNSALEIALKINNSTYLGNVYNNIAIYFRQKSELDSSIVYHQKAIDVRLKSKYKFEIASSFVNIGIVYSEKGDFKKAIFFGEQGKELLLKGSRADWLCNTYELLSQSYKKDGNVTKALEMFEKYVVLKDSLFSQETQAQLLKHGFEVEYAKKAATDSLKASEEREIHLLQSKKEKLQRYILYGGIGFIFIVAALIFWRFRASQRQRRIIELQKKKVEHQKEIIEEKHKEITDSINYAERLQRSLMASTKLLNAYLNEYFIYFNPKEKVSGDFYWCNQLSNGRFLLACADSTGHGVPGAIMSMMNMNSLKESVKEGLIEPALILNRTREIIINTLKNDGTVDGGKDGMDCALLSFDFSINQLAFALANNPLWLIRDGQLQEYKPDKMPVGKHDKQHVPFTQQEIKLEKGDFIIVLTDGYPDQFGGAKGKKFKYSNLQKLLLSMSLESTESMNTILQMEFNKWKGDLEQVDDVCVIGIRI